MQNLHKKHAVFSDRTGIETSLEVMQNEWKSFWAESFHPRYYLAPLSEAWVLTTRQEVPKNALSLLFMIEDEESQYPSLAQRMGTRATSGTEWSCFLLNQRTVPDDTYDARASAIMSVERRIVPSKDMVQEDGYDQ